MKDYEFTAEQKTINLQFLAVVGVALIILAFMLYPVFKPKDIPKTNITPNVSTITIYKEIIVTVTPTPDGKLYFADEYQSGVRKINRPFSWYREDVSGKKDMSVHVTVYAYRVFNSFTWFNAQDYKYYKQFPTSIDNKFVFVFVQIYMDDIIGNDARMWLPDEKHFALQVNNKLNYPIADFPKHLRIKELEETFDKNDVNRVSYYGTERTYEKGNPKTAGETTINFTYLKGGISNAIDGYLVYEIPKDIPDEELKITASFNSFGNSAWILKPFENEYDYKPY